MKKLLKYLGLTLLAVICIDLALRPAFNYLFTNPPASVRATMTHRFNREQSDVLILGASRASHHYNCQLIIDSLGVTCFNAGHDGQPIYNQYLNLLRSLQNGPVHTVLLDLSSAQLCRKWMTERTEPLLPYYWSDDSVRAIIDHVSDRTLPPSVLYCSSLVQFNSQLHQFMQYFSSAPAADTLHGYEPLPYTGSEFRYTPAAVTDLDLDPRGEDYLLRMATLCGERGIRFYVVVSPSLDDLSMFTDYLHRFCAEHQIQVLDYSTDERFRSDLSLWKDGAHMNARGADLFTAELLPRLR